MLNKERTFLYNKAKRTDQMTKGNMLTPDSNMRWESSRMMLPEHREAILARKKAQMKVEKPAFDEQQIEDMENLICESMEFVFPLQFKVYDNGYFREVTGLVEYINGRTKQLHVVDIKGDTTFIRFEDIVDFKKK
ncbi:YolD-like family protein [Bacillus gobiensis]|uniref:YolD-like family protein n=1 Tax=Bacillus gobiensis TaxID=1441095 RepID=UPI003D1B210B